MVKADPTHDYYADLELPSTADSETIKKQFRLLAKQYHPDRNPGKEIDVIPRFQAIQAANEVLSDPVQKKRYDADRAVSSTSHAPPPPPPTGGSYNNFKKPAKPPPPPSQFPPPPKRNPNLNKPFGSSNARPASSASAEKFAQFARAAPQQWDRAKYEEAAKAETLRNLHNMRPQSQGPPPRVPPRAPPTAPRPPSAGPSPDTPHAPGPQPGFPGLSRTNSGRRQGFVPGTPGRDEPPASSSAYAHVHRSDRPPSQPSGFSYPPGYGGTAASPPMPRARPSVSPLRTTKSSGFEDVQRPGLHRSTGKYSSNTGEKTDINGPGLTRSTSVRNSPTGTRWEESGAFGSRPYAQQRADHKVPHPRHRSSSPRGRSTTTDFQYSASETSSSDEESPRGERVRNRPKATPRKPQVPPPSNTRPPADQDPALTGQFPSNNYNKNHENKYNYPVPGTRAPNQRYFPETTNPVDDITQGLNSSGIRHVHREDVPLKKYEFPFSHYKPYDPRIGPLRDRKQNRCDSSINGIPVWALPASVYPVKRSRKLQAAQRSLLPQLRETILDFGASPTNRNEKPCGHLANTPCSQSSHRPNGTSSEPQSAAKDTNTTFSAAEWDGKFANGENVFRPTESTSRSRSPNKSGRPKLPNRNRGTSRSQNDGDGDEGVRNDSNSKVPGVRHVAGMADGLGKAAAFQAGKFSAEDWGQKLRSQSNNNVPKVPLPEKATPNEAKKQPTIHDEVEVEEHPSSPEQEAHPQAPSGEPDAMDIDESVPGQTPLTRGAGARQTESDSGPRRHSASGVNLQELKETAPFKPTATGLHGLGDLNDTLPFQSRAAEELNLRQPPSSGPAARHLNLPAPPKPVMPPDERHLTQESWSKYSAKMTRYMDDWNIFNCKMIDHFRTRQEQISLAMYHNWVTAVGDGASADDFDGLDFVGSEHDNRDLPSSNGAPHVKPKKAGYATYMQWLEQDQVCRTWWDVAFDEHRTCMEDLGRVRTLVKSIRAKESGKG